MLPRKWGVYDRCGLSKSHGRGVLSVSGLFYTHGSGGFMHFMCSRVRSLRKSLFKFEENETDLLRVKINGKALNVYGFL